MKSSYKEFNHFQPQFYNTTMENLREDAKRLTIAAQQEGWHTHVSHKQGEDGHVTIEVKTVTRAVVLIGNCIEVPDGVTVVAAFHEVTSGLIPTLGRVAGGDVWVMFSDFVPEYNRKIAIDLILRADESMKYRICMVDQIFIEEINDTVPVVSYL